jgi:casein kinase 1
MSTISNPLDNYDIYNCIGKGQFGTIYFGRNNKTNKNVAIKVESGDTSYITLKNEAKILRYLYDNKCREIPCIYWYGKINNNIILIIPKYECSLYDFVLKNELNYNLINTFMLKMLSLIEDIHNLYVVHRDIKPHHFMIKNNDLFLIDFGISTFYVDGDKNIITNNEKTELIGSPNYVSYFIHCGNTYSPRDDLLSIAYIFYFMNKRCLPWDNIPDNEYTNNIEYNELSIFHPKNEIIKELKEGNSFLSFSDDLRYNNFSVFISYIYNLTYQEQPNYTELIAIFYD